MTIRYDGRVAVITGAGRGLGRAHALELARRGAQVVINDLGGGADGLGASSEAAEAVAAEIRDAGGEAIADGHDIASRDGARALIGRALDVYGQIDILINNAGILRDKSFRKMDLDDFERVMQVHVMGSVYCTKAAIEPMIERNYGRIVLTGSASGLYGNFGQTNYAAAKMALIGFMNALKQEVAKYDIRVNTVAPIAATRMMEGVMPEEILAKVDPSLASPAALYFCAEDCLLNGQIIEAGGGFFGAAQIVGTPGVAFPPEAANVDKVAEAITAIIDPVGAQPYSSSVLGISRAFAKIN